MARRADSRRRESGRRVPQQRSAGNRTRGSRNTERTVRRRANSRRRQKILFRLVCGLLVLAVCILAPTTFFRVSHVKVRGATRYTEQELVETSGVREGDNMVFLDKKGIAFRLQAQYPYLDMIKVHRRLPSTVQIEVAERTAVISVESNGGYLLVDEKGKVLEEVGQIAPDTAEVVGIEPKNLRPGDLLADKLQEKSGSRDSKSQDGDGAEKTGQQEAKLKKLETALGLIATLTQYEMNTEVRRIDMEKAYDVRMEYAGRYTVLLGSLSNLEHKIQFLQAILKEPSLPDTGIIDLTDDKKAHYRPAEAAFEDTSEEADTVSENGEDTSGTEKEGEEKTSAGDETEDEASE